MHQKIYLKISANHFRLIKVNEPCWTASLSIFIGSSMYINSQAQKFDYHMRNASCDYNWLFGRVVVDFKFVGGLVVWSNYMWSSWIVLDMLN